MIALIGLGNPTEAYTHNRHNVGFLFLDFVASQLLDGTPFKFDKYVQAEILSLPQQKLPAISHTPLADLLLVKPQTYMNKSGDSVKKIFMNHKLALTDLVVVHDDLDIPFGKFKISRGVGPKLHNGIESIEHALKTTDFVRLRIGVDNRTPARRIPGEAYVLQNFTAEEKTSLKDIFSAAWQGLAG